MAIIQAVEDGQIVSSTTSTTTSTASNEMGYEQFLTLLCAEMQYQDPLEPTSNTEYVAQLATFSQLEATLSMQETLEQSNANSLVGQYVIIKTTSSSTGETTAIGGFVDYIQKESTGTYLCVNGSLYSVDDVYQVADTEYMEAIALAEAFTATVANFPDADELTLSDQEDVENLQTVYESLTSYQKSFLSSDTISTYEELVAKMEELVAAAEEEESTDTDDTTTDTDDTTTDTDDTTTGTDD